MQTKINQNMRSLYKKCSDGYLVIYGDCISIFHCLSNFSIVIQYKFASSQVGIIPGELGLHMHNLKYIHFSNIIFDWDSPDSIMSSLLPVQMLYDKAIAYIYYFIHVPGSRGTTTFCSSSGGISL